MSFSFNAKQGLVIVQSEIFGPSGSIILRLALDTGATSTMINVAPLASIGYDPSLSSDRILVTTGSGVEYAPRFLISRIRAIGHDRSNFFVLAHTLPPSAGIDGLLGLDFLRGYILNLDLDKGVLTLN